MTTVLPFGATTAPIPDATDDGVHVPATTVASVATLTETTVLAVQATKAVPSLVPAVRRLRTTTTPRLPNVLAPTTLATAPRLLGLGPVVPLVILSSKTGNAPANETNAGAAAVSAVGPVEALVVAVAVVPAQVTNAVPVAVRPASTIGVDAATPKTGATPATVPLPLVRPSLPTARVLAVVRTTTLRLLLAPVLVLQEVPLDGPASPQAVPAARQTTSHVAIPAIPRPAALVLAVQVGKALPAPGPLRTTTEATTSTFVPLH